MVSVEHREPLANCEVIDFSDVRCGAFLSFRLFVRWVQMIKKLLKVTFVVPQSVRAHVAFITQVIEELRAKLIEHRIRGAGFW